MNIAEYQLFGRIYDQFKQNNVEFSNIMMEILDFEMKKSLNLILATKNFEAKDSSRTIIRKQITIKKKADITNKEKLGMILAESNVSKIYDNITNSTKFNNMQTE